MHVILKDQGPAGEASIMCVERDAQQATILQADFDKLDTLVEIAKSMKVSEVKLVVDPQAVPTFQDEGWEVTDKVVLTKKANGK